MSFVAGESKLQGSGGMARRTSLAYRCLVYLLASLLVFTQFPVAVFAQDAPIDRELVDFIADPSEMEPSSKTENSDGHDSTGLVKEDEPALQNDDGGRSNALAQDVAESDGGSTDDLGSENTDGSSFDSANWEGESAQGSSESQPQSNAESLSAFAGVIGVDADGAAQVWAEAEAFELPAGSTAADLSEAMFEKAGIEASYDPEGAYGWYLDTIASPFDGRVLGWDQETGRYWQLFVNGVSSEVGAGSVVLQPGDSVSWCYAAYGEQMPGEQDLVIDADAVRPNWDSSWPGHSSPNGAVESSTPTQGATDKWIAKLDVDKTPSDPILVGEYLYAAGSSTLYMIDRASGDVVRQAALATSIDSVSRMAYSGGIIIVPLHGGRLQALTADSLTTVWLTQALPAEQTDSGSIEQQSLGSLVVHDGYAYLGTSDGNGGTGYMVCVRLSDGHVEWTNTVDGGYYWAGAVSLGSYMVVGDDSGDVYSIDPQTGSRCGSSVNIGARVRSGLVTDGSFVYASAYDGTLYKLSVGRDGSLRIASSTAFGRLSTSTPVIVDGKIYVCGQSATEGTGKYAKAAALYIIDADSMRVEREVCRTEDGELLPLNQAQSAPLVVRQGSDIFIYFTVNALPGGVYRYRVGDQGARLIYTPSSDKQNYSIGSVIADSDGSLYYVNDSGNLFALSADDSQEPSKPNDPATKPDPDDSAQDETPSKPTKRPGGTVAPSSKPVAKTSSKDSKDSDSKGEDSGVVSGELSSEGERDASDEQAGHSNGTARDDESILLPVVAGAIGCVGLVAALVWWLASKRSR